jgi:hypothetical protein
MTVNAIQPPLQPDQPASYAGGPAGAGLTALAAGGPDPELADKLMLFGQFVGAWDVDLTWHRADGSHDKSRGEWHFGWALNGRAVQDVWIMPGRSQRKPGEAGEWGTTIRFYDPSIDAWRVAWAGPGRGSLFTFTARPVGEEIVLEGETADGEQMRWIFSEITRDSFHWRSVVSPDSGKTWQPHQDMEVYRQGSRD